MKRLLYTLGALAIGLLLVVAPQAAQASTVTPACSGTYTVSYYNYAGKAICGFHTDSVDYGGGNIEYFVVGANYHIFHIWKGSNGWHDLNGIARSASPNGVWAIYYDNETVTLQTIGTNNYWYCDYKVGGVWGGWVVC